MKELKFECRVFVRSTERYRFVQYMNNPIFVVPDKSGVLTFNDGRSLLWQPMGCQVEIEWRDGTL